jgi:hypothetical protein
VIVTSGNDMARETARIAVGVPIVMGLSSGPVEAGLVTSLTRPGGYITGFTVNTGPELETKRLELLKEAVPKASQIFFSWAISTIGRNRGAQASALRRFHWGSRSFMPSTRAPSTLMLFALIARDKPHALFVARNGRWYPNP